MEGFEGHFYYYDVSKESPAGGLCGGLCGRVVREVVRGTLGGCAGRLGVFLVGCALRPVHSFFACFWEPCCSSHLPQHHTPLPKQCESMEFNSFSMILGPPAPHPVPKTMQLQVFSMILEPSPPHSFQKPCKSMFPLLHQKHSKACKT